MINIGFLILMSFTLLLTLIKSQNNGSLILFKNISDPGFIPSVKYSPDGRFLAYTAASSGVIILNAFNFSFVNSTNVDFAGARFAYAMCYAPNQSKLYYNIQLATVIGTRPISSPDNLMNLDPIIPSIDISNVYDIDVSHDSTRLIRCGHNTTEIVDLTNNNVIHQYNTSGFGSRVCKFSKKDRKYAAVRQGFILEIFDENYINIGTYNDPSFNSIQGLDWNSQGTSIALIINNVGLLIFNISTLTGSL